MLGENGSGSVKGPEMMNTMQLNATISALRAAFPELEIEKYDEGGLSTQGAPRVSLRDRKGSSVSTADNPFDAGLLARQLSR